MLSGGLLIALAIPYLRIELGFAGASSLPAGSSAARAFAILDEEFTAGEAIPTEVVVVASDVTTPQIVSAVERLEQLVAADSAKFGALGIVLNTSPTDGPSTDGGVHLTTLALPGDANSEEASAALARLRDDIVPEAFSGTLAEVFVGGQTAFGEDFFSVVNTYTPIVFALVLSLSFLLLLMVFRSLIVPLKAIIMNLLSVGAAYGILVLIFQEGFLADVLGFQQVPTIEAWVPLFLFMILFGLSMDYHVFLLSRIRERYDQTGDNAGSVAFGLRSTANIITGRGDHGRRLRRLRPRSAGDVPAVRLRPRLRRLPRRDGGPHGPRPRDHGAARRPQLVPALVARLAPRLPRRGRPRRHAHSRDRGRRPLAAHHRSPPRRGGSKPEPPRFAYRARY